MCMKRSVINLASCSEKFLFTFKQTRITEERSLWRKLHNSKSLLHKSPRSFNRFRGARTILRTIKTSRSAEYEGGGARAGVHTLLCECPYNLQRNPRRSRNPTKHFRPCAPAVRICVSLRRTKPREGRGWHMDPETHGHCVLWALSLFCGDITPHTLLQKFTAPGNVNCENIYTCSCLHRKTLAQFSLRRI